MARAVVVMGVSGSGKSTLGLALGKALAWPFIEGDTLHPPANIAKMSAGIPLDDADRQPFLENVAQVIAERASSGVVVSCSALKRRYRDLIRARGGSVTFVWPMLEAEGLFLRLASRPDHFMPAALLQSQLDALEPPQPDEQAIRLDGAAPVDAQLVQVLDALRLKLAEE